MKYLIDRRFGSLKQIRSQMTRDRIILAAHSLCEDSSKLTIESVAQRANCSVPTLRRHFKGKSPLCYAALIYGASEFLNDLEKELVGFTPTSDASSCRALAVMSLSVFPTNLSVRRQLISSMSGAEMIEVFLAFNSSTEQIIREGIAKSYNLHPSSLDPDRLYILARLITTVVRSSLLEQDSRLCSDQFIDSLSEVFCGLITDLNPR